MKNSGKETEDDTANFSWASPLHNDEINLYPCKARHVDGNYENPP